MAENQTHNANNSLEERLAILAGRILGIVSALETNGTNHVDHVADQLRRSGTAPGAHYAEATCAQSNQDFVHKVSLAAKEAREALYWLEVIDGTDLLNQSLDGVINEMNEIVAIMYSSMMTARKNLEDD